MGALRRLPCSSDISDGAPSCVQQMTLTHHQTDDYKLREIISGCLSGEETVPVAKRIGTTQFALIQSRTSRVKSLAL